MYACMYKWAAQGIDQDHGHKDCPNCLISVPTMVGGIENL